MNELLGQSAASKMARNPKLAQMPAAAEKKRTNGKGKVKKLTKKLAKNNQQIYPRSLKNHQVIEKTRKLEQNR